MYRQWIITQQRNILMPRLHEIQGKVLGCYCKPEKCHADVLAELADEQARMKELGIEL